jgi:hypothetical protein
MRGLQISNKGMDAVLTEKREEIRRRDRMEEKKD